MATVVVAVDFEDAETGKMEAGSGIKSIFPRAVFSTHEHHENVRVGNAVGDATLTREGSTV